MKAENIPLSKALLELIEREPFITAHDGSEVLEITVQKASAVLRSMENEGKILSKRVKAGMNEVKCYYQKGVNSNVEEEEK